MQRCVEENEIEALVAKRQNVERCLDELKLRRRMNQKIGRRAQSIDVVVANVQRNRAMSERCHTITEPAVSRAKIEEIDRPRRRQRLQDPMYERFEAPRTDGPLPRESTFKDVGKRSQLFTAKRTAFLCAVTRVLFTELHGGNAHGATISVRSNWYRI